MTNNTSKLAIFGGAKSVQTDSDNMFAWPIVTKEIEDAVLDVLRAGAMSGTDITKQFEKEYADWLGVKYALGHSTGTGALHAAMFGLGIGHGDEIICPSITYWASALPIFSLGGTVVFADIDPETLCIDPNDIERHISERTKAIVVVHYCGMPADMDLIIEIAEKHDLKVIEDVSHAHGGKYKGKMLGAIGDVSAYSLMSGKSFACGEAGILCTNDQRLYERALAFGHYGRHSSITLEEIKSGAGLPWGGYKYRMHQMSSAMARVQLKYYSEQMAEIDKAMNYFWDLLEGMPGLGDHRPKEPDSTKGGWYAAHGIYRKEELDGLSISRFSEAVRAEGASCGPGCNSALHLHPVFNTIDIYNQGQPTRIANSPEGVDVRQPRGSLPISEGIQQRVFSIPWFKHYRPKIIEEYAAAYRKVAENYRELLADDSKEKKGAGRFGLSERRG